MPNELIMEENSYFYTQLSADSVKELIESHYDLPELTRCRLYVLGLHDNYLIETGDRKYILRIYRKDWRSQEEALFELELLAFLGDRAGGVAFPVPTSNSELSFTIDSPEGQREAALFPYARGYAPGKEISIEESHLLGKAVANIHNLSDDFIPSYERRILDINYLLDDSVAAIGPFLDSSSRVYLKILRKRLHHALASVSIDKMLVGICIGDVNASNFHIDTDKQLTLFDFDQCGYGFRAFDIGKYISSLPLNTQRKVLRMAFIDGYKRVRTLTPQEYASIPYFEIISVIWVMAIHVYNVDRIGYKLLEGPFWNQRMAILKQLDKRAQWA